tara:strand:- start:1666 stop:1977 length:312 start_codon:yes stop_codon:yes gene_type:complete
MARRLFPDNDAWPEETSRAGNEVAVSLMDLLALLEEDGPVDLRDFHFLVSSTVGAFVAELSICRRLGDSAEPPRAIIRDYPRLSSESQENNVNLLPLLEVSNG